MFVITGIKNNGFIVSDTEDSSKEVVTREKLLHYSNDLGIQIKGVYENGVVCIWSHFVDKLITIENGTPLVLMFKNVGSERHVLFAGFNMEKCGFSFIDETGAFILTSRYLKKQELSRTLDIGSNIDPIEIAKIKRRYYS